MDRAFNRRAFIEFGAAGVAFVASGGLGAMTAVAARPQARPTTDEPWIETDVSELQRLMRRGKLTSRQLTEGYLHRIAQLNPILGAVIETNPDATRIARQLDAERRSGRVRGPLHGIPVIVKDNIATADKMQTTAGSLALVGSRVPSDATLVRQLRDAGAIILGKANLSEWANFRGGSADFPPINGWSGRGGFTRNPYVLDLDPCGSSSGSAASAAASLCAVAVGTETDGSILCPSGEQSLVGIKPTVGLVSGNGIIPIAHSQDTAGPITRSVRDAALLLDALRTPQRRLFGQRLPHSYTDFLDAGGLAGARLAYDHRYVEGAYGPGDDTELALIDGVLDSLRRAGATVVDVTSVDPALPDASGRIPFDDEFVVLLYEFKVQIAEYLAPVRHTAMRTLADLIQFNRDHCDDELKWFGQEVFELAEATSGDLNDPEYLAAKATNQGFGKGVIDGVLAMGFDAVITPSFSFGTSPAATSGYPSMAVPVGHTPDGRPVGLWLAASLLQEPTLIRIGYAIEQLLHARVAPTLAGSVPPDPTPFPGCDAITAAAPVVAAQTEQMHMHPRHW
ncbi:MAG: amidase family protein [Ilumatobacteraceae bacterium]